MNITKFPGLNRQKHNFENIEFPYNWALQPTLKEKRKVIFFGNDYRNLPFANLDEYTRLTNLCLEYVRTHCSGLELYYKPHPAETDEFNLIDLQGFTIIQERNNAEIFLYQNRDDIKYIFSASSWASAAAYSFGISSYIFLELFRICMGTVSTDFYRKLYFSELPESFFIDSFDQEFTENVQAPIATKIPESFRALLARKPKKIWFIMSDISFSATAVALAKQIKKENPSQHLALVISKHLRWNLIDVDFLTSHFNEIITLPRFFYSLRPARLFNTIKLALRIRKIKTDPSDIIFGFSGFELVENAFISYHSHNYRVSFLNNRDLPIYYETDRYPFFKEHLFYWTKASFFQNKVLEPLLGLNRTIFVENTEENILILVRYQKPINEVYNQVYVLSISRTRDTK
ncbi:MAG: hypothetical protein NUV65_00950 [Candidatus Roizmanbacteria bacterium]|nr:hypothetical protein [Candidatus Roizmanbacteria bacterium]